MRKLLLFFIMGVTLPVLITYGQDIEKIRPLSIGDTVPNFVLTKILNYKTLSAPLTDFDKELIIFDFMSTGCKSCVEALSRLDSLQAKYETRVQVIIVTPQKSTTIQKFLQNHPISLPIIAEDTILKSRFPHKFISHEVWIHKGIVKAITSIHYVTDPNIKEILNNTQVNWPIKSETKN